MLDFLRKEKINSYFRSNIGLIEVEEKRVLINGRYHTFDVEKPYAVASALIWKVPVVGSKQFKYVATIGIARQNPLVSTLHTSLMDGIELSETKAYSDPSISVTCDTYEDVMKNVDIIVNALFVTPDDKFVFTEEEATKMLQTADNAYAQKYPLDGIAFNIIKAFT